MSPDPAPTPGDEPQPDSTGSGPLRWLAVVGAGMLLAVAAGLFVVVATGGDPAGTGQEYEVVIPRGTAARIDAGEEVELIPSDLQLDVHTTFVVRNDDVRLHEVGPFAVRAGEVLSFDFNERGVYQGSCSVHPSGTVTITIV